MSNEYKITVELKDRIVTYDVPFDVAVATDIMLVHGGYDHHIEAYKSSDEFHIGE